MDIMALDFDRRRMEPYARQGIAFPMIPATRVRALDLR